MKNNNENENLIEIAKWLEEVRFRKQFFGGLSEEDVWKKISDLNEMYENALKAERIRYESMIEHYKNTSERLENGERSYD